jgi:hypothetical protein
MIDRDFMALTPGVFTQTFKPDVQEGDIAVFVCGADETVVALGVVREIEDGNGNKRGLTGKDAERFKVHFDPVTRMEFGPVPHPVPTPERVPERRVHRVGSRRKS